MSGRIWSRSTIIAAIRAEARAGHELSYSRIEKRVPSLLHAAERIFGHWASAVEAAGFDYNDIRRYRRWTRDRVIERIREWDRKNADLSWHHVSNVLDPPLAAAALHADRFSSWSEALREAGLDPDNVSRYRRWTLPAIQDELSTLAHQGVNLDQETLAQEAPALLAAIYRLGGGLVAQRGALERQLLAKRAALRRQMQLEKARLQRGTPASMSAISGELSKLKAASGMKRTTVD